MTTRSRSALARLATASLLAAGLTGLTAVTARAAAGCSNDGVGTVTVALDGSPSTITAPVANLDPFVVDGSSTNCDSGTQTVHVVGTAGDDTVRLRFVASGQIVTGGLLTADKAELQVDLAGGNDTLIIETTPFADTVASSAVGISVTSQSQDVATDSVEAVTVETGAGDDTVDLSADADYAVPTPVQPGAGLDTVTGGAAGDTFVATPAGDTSDAEADSFTGGGGADAVDYTARLGSVTVDVGTPAGSGETGEGDTVGTDIETFRTGSGDDTVFGDNFGQTIETGDGNDSVYPMGGDDTVDVGTGGDNVDAGSGDDGADTYLGSSDATLDYTGRSVALTINLVLADQVGEPGEGDMVAGFGTVKGGSGADTIVGTTMAEHLIGGPGKDVITGGGGADVLEGDGGNDTFPQGAAPDGSDTVVGGSGIDRIDYSQRTTLLADEQPPVRGERHRGAIGHHEGDEREGRRRALRRAQSVRAPGQPTAADEVPRNARWVPCGHPGLARFHTAERAPPPPTRGIALHRDVQTRPACTGGRGWGISVFPADLLDQ